MCTISRNVGGSILSLGIILIFCNVSWRSGIALVMFCCFGWSEHCMQSQEEPYLDLTLINLV